jgi:hypothetical protein
VSRSLSVVRWRVRGQRRRHRSVERRRRCGRRCIGWCGIAVAVGVRCPLATVWACRSARCCRRVGVGVSFSGGVRLRWRQVSVAAVSVVGRQSVAVLSVSGGIGRHWCAVGVIGGDPSVGVSVAMAWGVRRQGVTVIGVGVSGRRGVAISVGAPRWVVLSQYELRALAPAHGWQ